jgi:periplasmic protein TonB
LYYFDSSKFNQTKEINIMNLQRKKPEADLRNSYNLYLQTGMIVTLLLMIGLFRAPLEGGESLDFTLPEQEIVEIEEIIQTEQVETPPPPPRPPVPVEVPNDEILDDELLDLGFELDLAGPLDLPPPPPPSDDEEEPEIFVVVERMPEPRGGMQAIYDRVRYPEIARKAGIEGRVVVQFIVDEQGNVVNPTVIRGIGGGCDEAAIAAVQGVRFTPGMQRGRPVKVQFQLPIVFRLQN